MGGGGGGGGREGIRAEGGGGGNAFKTYLPSVYPAAVVSNSDDRRGEQAKNAGGKAWCVVAILILLARVI